MNQETTLKTALRDCFFVQNSHAGTSSSRIPLLDALGNPVGSDTLSAIASIMNEKQVLDLFKRVTSLPSPGVQTTSAIYLVKQSQGVDEYEMNITVLDNNIYSWLKIGTTNINLDDYYTKTETDNALATKLSEISINDFNSIFD